MSNDPSLFSVIELFKQQNIFEELSPDFVIYDFLGGMSLLDVQEEYSIKKRRIVVSRINEVCFFLNDKVFHPATTDPEIPPCARKDRFPALLSLLQTCYQAWHINIMEIMGFEPTTSALRTQRSPS